MVHLGAWATFFLGSRPFGGLTVFDWVCVIVIAGCVQTVWVRLASTLRLLAERKARI
jgi:hypothetical protein